jgi:hypothetical protein
MRLTERSGMQQSVSTSPSHCIEIPDRSIFTAKRGTFNFGGSDQIVNWATSNGKLIRGNTLGMYAYLGFVATVH